MGRSRLSIGSVSPLVLLVAVLASCGERGQDDVPTEEIDRALTTITISGRVTDANGLALAHLTVTLSGNVQTTKQTDAQGNYAFTGLNPGSYSVRPTLTGCAFQPDVVNLNNLTASSVQNFGGSGTACGGATTVNTGATSGPFTISGQLTDASGKRIVGGRVN